MKIRKSSAGYMVAAEDGKIAIDSLKQSGLALTNPLEFLKPSMLAAFDKITSILRSLDCALEVRSLVDEMRWEIVSETWPQLRARAVVKDEASIVGVLQRVGGATERKCGISVDGESRMRYCHVSSEGLLAA